MELNLQVAKPPVKLAPYDKYEKCVSGNLSPTPAKGKEGICHLKNIEFIYIYILVNRPD